MILITGITGKSGGWFLKKLIKEKEKFKEEKFRVVVRQSSNVELIDKSGLSIEKVIGDLDDTSFVKETMKDISTVVHIAGIHSSLNVVKAVIQSDVRRLIMVHTTGIYSRFKVASSGYLEIERQIEEMLKGKNINTTILRPTMIYGSVADKNVVVFIKMVDKLRIFPVINHANYPLQPVHEKDLGEAYYQVFVNPEITKNKNYILSGKEPILLIDMFKVIGEYLGKKNTFISVPFPIAYFGAWCLFILTLGQVDFRERVQRLIEPRTFPYTEAANDFGYSPIGFKEGVKNEVLEYLAKNK